MQQTIYPLLPILLVDDEPQILLISSVVLRTAGINNFTTVGDSREVMPLLALKDFSLIVIDLSMPHVSGHELLNEINSSFPQVPVIVVTATDDLDTAVDCMRSGAFDYLVKPVDMNRFLTSVKKALEMSALKKEVSSLKQYLLTDQLEHEAVFSQIITASKKMRSLFQYIEAIASSHQPVLITGETGVGKELIAAAIHELSGREGPFLAVNIAGLDDTIFSDTLFGHKKGAYTGAEDARDGLVLQASGGTLFLDEIADLKETSQVKLLRLLQERKYFPLGSDIAKQSDARFVVATNRDIQAMISDGRFRKDLYYRLRGHQINIPPLRERTEDIELLLNHFFEEAAISLGKTRPSYPRELITLLTTYQFPGNIRELRSMVFDAVARHRSGIVSMDSFKEVIRYDSAINVPDFSSGARTADLLTGIFGKFPTLKEAEDFLISEAMRLSKNNQGIAASLLGLTRQALNKRLNRAE
jgi:DNA-binding NtrC family response regulator